ncbi:MAG: High-affinity zinc uptake system membrane protein ZnuB [Holosporales bacterium]
MDHLLYTILPTLLVLVFLLAPLGCFLMWQRMAFLSDTLSHSAILGVALGLFFNISVSFANLIFIGIFVLMLQWLLKKEYLPRDTVMSLLSYGGTSIGLIILHFEQAPNHFQKVLLGNVLTVSVTELSILFSITCVVLFFLFKYQKSLILMILDKDLAKISGVSVEKLENVFLLLTALAVAFSMQCVGALIVPALLIIPSAAVRSFSFSYHAMIRNVLFFAAFFSPMGVLFLKKYDLPFGPSLVVTYLLGFLSVQLLHTIYKNLKKQR